MDEQNKGPAERIVQALVGYTDHAVHNRPGIVVPDGRTNVGVRWEPGYHKDEDGEKVFYRQTRRGNRTIPVRAGVIRADNVVVENGREVGRYQPAGLFPEVTAWMYRQVADIWQMDNEFAAKWASFEFGRDHRDLKVVLAAFMLVQSRKGDPVFDQGKVAFHDQDYRDVGEAMLLTRPQKDKARGFDAKLLLRVREVLELPAIAAINRELGFGRSPREPFLGRWAKAVEKWLRYLEHNPRLLRKLVQDGWRTSLMLLCERSGFRPESPYFFHALRWKQKVAKDGRRVIGIGAEVAAAESWEGLTEEQVCDRIVKTKPNWKRITALLPPELGVTRAVMAAALETGCLSDKDIVIATPTLEELGLLDIQEIRHQWERAVKAAEDMRAANIARNVKAKETKETLEAGADQVLQKIVGEVMRDMRAYFFIDISGSMTVSIEQAKDILSRFLQGFPLERTHVAVFNTVGREVTIPAASAAGVAQAFKGFSAQGGTDYGSGIRALRQRRLKPGEDAIFFFIGDEGQRTTFERDVRALGFTPVAFGLVWLPGDNFDAVSKTAAVLGIPCFRIDRGTFEDPYAIPRTLRDLIAATPVGYHAQVAKPRVTLVEQILQTDLLVKPAWAA